MKARVFLRNQFEKESVHLVVRICRMKNVDYLTAERSGVIEGDIPDLLVDLARSLAQNFDFVLSFQAGDEIVPSEVLKERLEQARKIADEKVEAGRPKKPRPVPDPWRF